MSGPRFGARALGLLSAPLAAALLLLSGCSTGQKVRLELALEGPPLVAEYFPRIVLELEVSYDFAPADLVLGPGDGL